MNNTISKIQKWQEHAMLNIQTEKDKPSFWQAVGMYTAFGMVLKLLTAEYCPKCHKQYNDEVNIDIINSLGRCTACDHVEGDDSNYESTAAYEN